MMTIDEFNIGHDSGYFQATDTDNEYVVKPVKYFGLSQEEGGVHATLRGANLKKMMDTEHRTWMILRTRMKIERYAKWMDEYRAETWCQKGFKLFCPRCVRAFNKKGELLFNAESLWIVMNMERLRPEKPEYIESRLPECGDKARLFNPDFPKFDSVEDYKGDVFSDERISINYYDYDYNRHVNNISYINWMMLSFPPEFLDRKRPSFIDCEWRKQCHFEDELYARSISKEKESNTFFTTIYRKTQDGGEEVVFHAVSTWEDKK